MHGHLYVPIFACFLLHAFSASMYDAYDKSQKFCYAGTPRVMTCERNETTTDPTFLLSIISISYERNCTPNCSCQGSNVNISCSNFSLPLSSSNWNNERYYSSLSGRTDGGYTTERVACSNQSQIFTNVLSVNVRCVNENQVLDFCSEFKTKNDSVVHVKYDGFTMTEEQTTCNCTAITSSGNLIVQAVDIRLQEFTEIENTYRNSTGSCTNNDSYMVVGNKTISCQDRTILGGYQTIYNTSEQHIAISLHIGTPPQMAWVAFKSGNGGAVEVTCKNTKPHTTDINAETTPTKTTRPSISITGTASTTHSSASNTSVGTHSPSSLSSPRQVSIQSNLTTTSEQPTRPQKTTRTVSSSNNGGTGKLSPLDPAIIVLVMTAVLAIIIILIGAIIVKRRLDNERLAISMDAIMSTRKHQRISRNSSSSPDYVKVDEFIDDKHDKPNQRQAKDDSSKNLNYAQIHKPMKITEENFKNDWNEIGDSLSFELPDDYDHLAVNRSRDTSKFFTVGNEYDHSSPENGMLFVSMHHDNSVHQDLNQSQNTISSSNHGDISFDQLSSDFINPYVDAAVTEGMKNQRDFMKSQTSIDRAMRDMVNHAQDWASTYSGDKNKLDRYDKY